MTWIVAWVSVLPLLVALLVATFVPGWLLLVAGGARFRLARIACAPALTFLLMGLGGVVFRALGVWWHLPTVVTYLLLCAAVVAAGRWLWVRRKGQVLTLRTWFAPEPAPHGLPAPSPYSSAMGAPGEPEMPDTRSILGSQRLMWAAVLIAWAVMILPMLPGSGPDIPIQSADSLYHYNQAWLIEHTGNASMLDGNAGMFGMDGHHSFYPMVWHAIVTLSSVGWYQVVPATNTLLLVVPLVWLIGMAYLARVILPEIRGSVYLVLGAGALTPIFPIRLLTDTAVWPYALALAACPATVAWAVAAWRRATWLITVGRRRRTLIVVAAPVAAVMGSVVTHPATAVIIGWPLAAVAWMGIVLAGIRGLRRQDPVARRRGIILLSIAVLVVLAVAVFVMAPGPQQAHFGRRPDRSWEPLFAKLVIPFLLYYGGGGWEIRAAYIIMACLSVLGAVLAYRRRHHRGIVVSWIACMALILAALAPIPVLSALTGVFYNNPHRIKAMTVVPALLLVTLGLDALTGRFLAWRHRRTRRVAGGADKIAEGAEPHRPETPTGRVPVARLIMSSPVVVGALVLVLGVASSMTAVRADVRGAFSPKYGQSRLVALNDELAMIKRLGTELPPDAYVLGDPVAGTAMLPFMAGLSSVWMFAGQADSDADGLYLRTHFRDLHFDPQVCEIVRRHRITHFYSDEPQRFNGVDNQTLRPGLYGVDLSYGFTLVDQGGSAAVYRIDLCWPSGEQ
ncbi:DUF6541 family protein [uncultured Actinomyces sp.]|uniref:DUF6541 family protein n=1 Tax=uncultured Actinomyces sp. TaxID=249061 RepID=UPI0028D4A55A|nr:DUF6541 family protein [uncultured Actinomyces sp.]